MELAIFIYLANLVGKAHVFFGMLIPISILFALLRYFWVNEQHEYHNNTKVTHSFKWVYLSIASAILLVIIPSERTMYMMAGGYAGQTIGTAVVQSELTKDVIKIIEIKAKKELSKMMEESTKETSRQ